MAEHEFERFLAVLSKLLKLSSKETAAVADELCDHLEERYSELVAKGVSREEAVRQALSEFENAGELATKLNRLVRQRTRRRIMTGALGTAVASAAAILITTAFWPDQPRGLQQAGAQAPRAAVKDSKPSDEEVVYIDETQFLPAPLRTMVTEELKPRSLLEFEKWLESGFEVTARLDIAALADEGVSPESTVPAVATAAPLASVLNRALENIAGTQLDWIFRDNVLHITTRSKSDSLKFSKVVDVSEALAAGFEMSQIVKLLKEHSTGPWYAISGNPDDGDIIPLGNRLTLLATRRTELECQKLLAALVTRGRRISLFDPFVTKAINEGLKTHVTADFHDAKVEDIVANLSRQAGIPIVFDVLAMTDAGTSPDSRDSLSVRNMPLRSALKLLLEEVAGTELSAITVDGLLTITTRQKADEIKTAEIFDVADLVNEDDLPQLIRSIQLGNRAQWREVSGNPDDGAVHPLFGCRIIVRNTNQSVEEVVQLLADHRRIGKGAVSVPAKDPRTPEIRYYRMSEQLAKELQQTIPQLVAVDSWQNVLSDNNAPAIRTISLGALSASGGRIREVNIDGLPVVNNSGAASSYIPISSVPEKGDPQPAFGPQSILAIRQSRQAHREIEKFLKDLEASYRSAANEGGIGGGQGGGFF